MIPYGMPPQAAQPGPATRHELLARRAQTLDRLVRQDLAPLRLASGALLTLGVAAAWTCFVGVVDELTREQGRSASAALGGTVGALLALGCALAVHRGRLPRRRREEQLYAWAAWHQHPAVQNTPVQPVPPGTHPDIRAPGHYGLRTLWVLAAVPAVGCALALLARGATEERPVVVVGFGGIGAILIAGAARGAWKAFRLAQRTRFSGIGELAGAEHLTRNRNRQSVRGTSYLGTASLTDPDTRIARFTARTPQRAVVAGALLLSAVSAGTAGGLFGGVAVGVGGVLALALVIVVGGYDYRPRYAMTALVAALCTASFGWAAQEDRILDRRGTWVDGVVTAVHPPKGRGTTYCTVHDRHGDPLPQRVPSCLRYDAGDPVRVLLDPQGEASPALSAPRPDLFTAVTAASAALFVTATTVGAARGHHNRRRLPHAAAQRSRGPGAA